MKISAFRGLNRLTEPHLLGPGALVEASNVLVSSGALRKRRGFIRVHAVEDVAADYRMLWPTCLPFLKDLPAAKSADGASSLSDRFSSWWNKPTWTPPTYQAAKAALQLAYARAGGSWIGHNLSGEEPSSAMETWTWEAKHFRIGVLS